MAQHDHVVGPTPSGWPLSLRSLPVALAVAIAVAVVVVGALSGAGSDNAPITVARNPADETSRLATAPLRSPAIDRVPGAEPILRANSGTAPSRTTLASSDIIPGRPDPASSPTRPDSFERYQVQDGESLSLIAAVRGLSLAELVAWNWGLNENSFLLIGQWIWIPQWQSPNGPAAVAQQSGEAPALGIGGRGGR